MAIPNEITQQTIPTWADRLQAIQELAEVTHEYYIKGNTDPDATIKPLLKRLQNFGGQAFRFFQAGLEGKRIQLQPPSLTDSPTGVTPESAATLILQQLSNDMAILLRVFDQRIVANLKRRGAGAPAVEELMVAETLAVADGLARSARQMFVDYLDKRTTALTYLHPVANVRLLPYAPVALIGVPITAIRYATLHKGENQWKVNPSRDFLAIPHEFAHYLYWYGKHLPTGRSLRAELTQRLHKLQISQQVMNWVEEIFADVVGCLIAGPVVARSIQDVILADPLHQFYSDNGTHPVNAIRPLIYTKTLALMGHYQKSAAELEAVWRDILRNLLQGEIKRTEAFEHSLQDLGQKPEEWEFTLLTPRVAPVQTNPLGEIFRVIAAIQEIIPFDKLKQELRWSADGTRDELYTQFDQKRIEALQAKVDELEGIDQDRYRLEPLDVHVERLGDLIATLELLDETDQQRLGTDWQKLFNGIASSEAAANNEPSSNQPPLAIPFAVWHKIFDFGGWTTEGPGSPRGQGGD